MPNHHELHTNDTQPDPSRPPQLNKTVCGCRCGRGSGAVQEGSGGAKDDDGGSTLVASEGSDAGNTFPHTSYEGTTNVPSMVTDVGVDLFRSRMELYMRANENRQNVMESFPRFFQGIVPDDDDAVDSMMNEPGSDSHSIMALSQALPPRCISPRLVVAGAGDWVNDGPSEYHLPFEYYFLESPLRLTPQSRYCRGLVASHLVLREDGNFEDDGERFPVDQSGGNDHFGRI